MSITKSKRTAAASTPKVLIQLECQEFKGLVLTLQAMEGGKTASCLQYRGRVQLLGSFKDLNKNVKINWEMLGFNVGDLEGLEEITFGDKSLFNISYDLE